MIKRISLFALLAAALGVASCTGEYSWVKNGIDTAVYQLEYMARFQGRVNFPAV